MLSANLTAKGMTSNPVLPELAHLHSFRVQKRLYTSHPPMREGRGCLLPIWNHVRESFKKTRALDLCPWRTCCRTGKCWEYSLTWAALPQQEKEETGPHPQAWQAKEAPLGCVGYPGGSVGKESTRNGWIPGSGRSLGKGMVTNSSIAWSIPGRILAWKIPRTDETGRLYRPRGCKESDRTEHREIEIWAGGRKSQRTSFCPKRVLKKEIQ